MNMGSTSRSIVDAVSEQQLRELTVRELGLEKLKPEDQDAVFKIVQETMSVYVQTALLQALGPEKVSILEAVPEDDDEAFSKQLVALLPDLQKVIDAAVIKCIHDNRAAFKAAMPKTP